MTHNMQFRGFAREDGFKKGGFGGCPLEPQTWNEGTKKGMKGTKNRNEGTNKNGTTVQKTGTRAHSPKPPLYETALNCFSSYEVSISFLASLAPP